MKNYRRHNRMNLLHLLFLLFALSALVAGAQTPTMIDELVAAQAALRAAQTAYDTKRDAVVRENAAAIAGLNIAVDPAAIAALRTDIDALKVQDRACAAVAKTAMDATSKATTIAGLRAAILPLLQCESVR